MIFTDYENPEQAMYQVFHHQFLASALVVNHGHKINSDFQIGCMIHMMPLYAATCKSEDLVFAQEAMRQNSVVPIAR